MSRAIVRALRLLATSCALNPSDRAAFDRHCAEIEGVAAPAVETPTIAVAAQPAIGLRGARARRNRSAVSGQIVSAETAASNPETTVSEARKRKPRKKKK